MVIFIRLLQCDIIANVQLFFIIENVRPRNNSVNFQPMHELGQHMKKS